MGEPSATIGDNKKPSYEDAKATAKAAQNVADRIQQIGNLDGRIDDLRNDLRRQDGELAKYIESEGKKGTLKLGVVYVTSFGSFVVFTNQISGSVETMSVTIQNVTKDEPIPF